MTFSGGQLLFCCGKDKHHYYNDNDNGFILAKLKKKTFSSIEQKKI
jgi:hypothetical protein